MPVSFQNADITFRLTNKKALQTFIAQKFEQKSGRKISVSYIFCSDDFLLDINKKFLDHDYYTDIITFPLSETERKTEAEIYISINRVAENAANLKQTFHEELLRVIFHGVLHLAGHKDKTSIQKREMRKAEEEWIKAYTKQEY